jgi:Zn-dependent metalloprotease
MLRAITERGSPAQREWALRTVTLSVQIRALRRAAAEFPSLVQVQRAVAQQKQRTVYSADGDSTLPGRKVRGEGDPPSSDPAVNEAYDGAGATYDMYSEVYKRNSIDDNGLKLDSTVHYPKAKQRFWDGQQMVYGDGDENLRKGRLCRFPMPPDIIRHELTGVTG